MTNDPRARDMGAMSRCTLLVLCFGVLVTGCDRKSKKPAHAGGDSDDGAPAPEAQALADSLLPRLERLSGLKATGAVRVRSQERTAVRRYVESRLERDLPPEKVASIRDTYALLGLVPDTLDLKALLLDLYTEQVIGYYDPASRTMFVLSGADETQLRPVLAHELVHALQDQHVRVDSLIGPDRGNDRQAAAHAALEGHATIVMFALLAEDAEQKTLDPALLPNPADALRGGLDPENNQFPVFARAPAVIRETLLFPYIGGANFVYTLWAADNGSKHRAPIAELLPQSTEQIIHARTRFLEQRDTPTDLRYDRIEVAGWRVRHEETMGELETGILLERYLGPPGRAFAFGWDGDRYILLEDAAQGRALVWYSIWDNAAAADIFVSAMKQVALHRPGRTTTVERMQLDGRAGVRIVDTAQGTSPPLIVPPRITK
ncbi:MAG: hypothetical protein ABIV28_03725 [Longimicrobiales bacterium]